MNDRLNNDMFGKKVSLARPLVILGILLLLAIALLASVKTSHASTSPIVAICDTVDSNAVSAYDGHNVDSSDASTRHCVETGNAPARKEDRKNSGNDTTSTSITVTVTPPSNPPVT